MNKAIVTLSIALALAIYEFGFVEGFMTVIAAVTAIVIVVVAISLFADHMHDK